MTNNIQGGFLSHRATPLKKSMDGFSIFFKSILGTVPHLWHPPIYEFRVCPRAILQSQSHKVDDNINFGPTQVSPDLPFFRLQGEPCPVHEADIITMLLHAKAYIEAGENPGAHKKLQDVTFGL